MLPRATRFAFILEYNDAMRIHDMKLASEVMARYEKALEEAGRVRLSTNYNEEWLKKRREILDRDGKCLECGSTERLEVDHRVPVYEGGAELDSENLRVLCHECHKNKTRKEVFERYEKYGSV